MTNLIVDKYKKKIWSGSTQLSPTPAVLIGCGNGSEKYPNNLITVAWCGVVCSSPPMLSISVRPERFSFPLIKDLGEFTVNIPTASMARAVDYCGVVSGKDIDKFNECNFTAEKGSEVSSPIVRQCPLNLECKVNRVIELGVHTMFIADIVAVQAAELLIDKTGKFNLTASGLMAYGHGHYYELGKELGHFGYSVRKKKSKKK